MKSLAMFGEKRSETGKVSTKLLRTEGKVPCVLYGNKAEPVHFFIYSADFKDIVYTPNTYTAKLSIDGQVCKAMLKDLQFHPVNESILHADFMTLSEDKPVVLEIPVKVVGNSPGVRAGGQLEKKIKKLRIRGLIKDMPDFIEVNIDSLEMAKSIKVGELSAANLTFMDSPVNAILSVVSTRAVKQADTVAAAAPKAATK